MVLHRADDHDGYAISVTLLSILGLFSCPNLVQSAAQWRVLDLLPSIVRVVLLYIGT